MFMHAGCFRAYDLVEGIVRSALVWLFLSLPLFAQQTIKPFEKQFPALQRIDHFERYTTEQGLSNSSCRGNLLVDREGFLWIGTTDGLNRFDGRQFTIFRNDPEDSTSISGNFIMAVHEDRTGSMWVGTWGFGLNRFDRASGKFYRYENEARNLTTISDNSIRCIYEALDGTLWIGTRNGGINRVIRSATEQGSPQRITFQQYTHSASDTKTISGNFIVTMFEDSLGSLWAKTNFGYDKFVPTTGTFDRSPVDPRLPGIFANAKPTSVLQRKSELWIGTSGGALCRDAATGIIRHFKHDPKTNNSLTSDDIKGIYEDSFGVVWTWGQSSGLNEWQEQQDNFVRHVASTTNPKSLVYNSVVALSEDRSRNLWIATNSGLSMLTQRARQFKSFVFHRTTEQDGGSQRALIASMRAVWCQDDEYLVRLDTSAIPRAWKLGPDVWVNDIFEENNQRIWIGTDRYGLGELTLPSGKLRFTSPPPPTKPETDLPTQILCILQDESGNLLLGTQQGLWKFNARTRSAIRLYPMASEPNEANPGVVKTLMLDKQGYLWFGTHEGLKQLSPNGRTVEWRHNPHDPATLSSDNISTIFEDVQGTIWVGTSQGLNRFERTSENFQRIGGGRLLGNITQLIQDKAGNIWIGEDDRGLSRLDPVSGELTTFSTPDGLPTLSFGDLLHPYVRSNGEIVISHGYGQLTVFHPDSIHTNDFIPSVTLTKFYLYDKQMTLPTDGIKHLPIVLQYDQNFFSMEFAALDLAVPRRNKYAYILEGLDNDWVEAGTKPEAHYTKVPPGEYVFRVKGSNSDGVWNEKGTFINITITPPWWRTTWAYISYFLIAGFVFYTARRYDMNRVRMKHELELEHVEAEKLREVDQMKSRFFANISHEFRTPLTLILGPIEKLRGRMGDGEMGSDLSMMERNANRLLRLINQLLDLSKLEAGGMKLQATPGNIVPFVKGIAQSFESSAGRRNVTLNIETERDEIEVYFDRDKLEKILVNLLSNAFKFTPEGGRVSVELRVKRGRIGERETGRVGEQSSPIPQFSDSPVHSNKEVVQIIVQDTGIGIPADQLDKVFDRFYQVDASQTREQEGTGIGLALTKELVELHHGTINVQSEVGKGTEFTVLLPLGRAHLKDEEVVETLGIEKRMGEGANGREGEISSISSDNSPLLPFSVSPTLPFSDSPSTRDAGQLHAETPGQTAPLVLIIEDNADVRAYIKSYLIPAYRFEEAKDGAEGVAKAREIIPDLIISDVMMPKMDGNEVCRQLKQDEKTSHIPIILLTAKAGQENKLEGLETGADDYLTKPFDAKELLVRVKNLIALRRKLRDRFRVGEVLKPGEIAVTSLDDQFLQKAMAVVEKQMSNEDFSVDDFAKETGMSRSQLHRKLTALTNQSPSDFIRYMRLHRGKELLEKNAGTISEIAFQVGFNSVAYFTKCFREQFGIVPSACLPAGRKFAIPSKNNST